jgi:hypothetical protein
MSMLGATILTAIAITVLAVGAIVTAVLAYLAFRKQSHEVMAIDRQVAGDQKLIQQQAKLIKAQTDQVQILRDQLGEQRNASARQAGVLDLQAKELRESLDQRKRNTEARRRAQAAKIFLTGAPTGPGITFGGPLPPPTTTATVVNSSDQPIYDAELHWPATSLQGSHGSHLFGTIVPGGKQQYWLPPNVGFSLWSRDAAGIKWILPSDGRFREQP